MKKLHIMICDDDPLDLEKTTQMVKEYDVSGLLQISACLQAKELLNLDISPSYDIVLLDIEMESPNGYDVAKQLVAKADPPVIIFVTQSSEYTLKGYGIALRVFAEALNGKVYHYRDKSGLECDANTRKSLTHIASKKNPIVFKSFIKSAGPNPNI